MRADTAQAVADFPAAALPFRPIDGIDGFTEVARHILGSGHVITGMLLAGVEDLTLMSRADLVKHAYPLPEDAGPPELAAALLDAVEHRCAELARATPEWWAQVITRWDAQRVTRLELVQMMKEHELTHRSQLFMYLRMKGIVPPTTRRRQAKQQAGSAR